MERLWPLQVAGVSECSRNFCQGHERSQDWRIPRSVLTSVMISNSGHKHFSYLAQWLRYLSAPCCQRSRAELCMWLFKLALDSRQVIKTVISYKIMMDKKKVNNPCRPFLSRAPAHAHAHTHVYFTSKLFAVRKPKPRLSTVPHPTKWKEGTSP